MKKPVINTDPEAANMLVKYFHLFILPPLFNLRRKKVLVSVHILVYCDLCFHVYIETLEWKTFLEVKQKSKK